jgi:hypothetical protein
MFYSPKLFLKDLWISVPIGASFLIQMIIWADLLLNIKQNEEQIFLHFNIVIGVDKVGNWWQIFYLPLVGIGVLLGNSIVSLGVYRSDKFLAKILSFWALFFHLFLLASIIFLVGLNS